MSWSHTLRKKTTCKPVDNSKGVRLYYPADIARDEPDLGFTSNGEISMWEHKLENQPRIQILECKRELHSS